MRDGDVSLLNRAENLVVDCLTKAGLGAKTAAGYGRFAVCKEDDSALGNVLEGLRKVSMEREHRRREAEQARIEAEEKARIEAARAKAEAERRKKISPQDLAYEDYVKGITDWTAPAREIKSRSPEEQQLILRFFRSPEGLELLKGWTNKKGKKRIQNLKEAGL